MNWNPAESRTCWIFFWTNTNKTQAPVSVFKFYLFVFLKTSAGFSVNRTHPRRSDPHNETDVKRLIGPGWSTGAVTVLRSCLDLALTSTSLVNSQLRLQKPFCTLSVWSGGNTSGFSLGRLKLLMLSEGCTYSQTNQTIDKIWKFLNRKQV